jgi:hypothetical protein
LFLCRDHALLAWQIVDDQIKSTCPPTPEPKEETPEVKIDGHVYYIVTAGRIKIGHSINVEQRLLSYPPGMEILYIRKGDRKLERDEHRRFRTYLTDGREWFEDRPEVRNKIGQLVADDPEWHKRWDFEYMFRRKRVAPRVTTKRIA